MSLHFLGLRDFPFLHRQFSSPKSPSSNTFESPTSAQDLTRDSKDVLIQRLNDLALRLVTEENLKDEDISALHIDVDHMERAMRSPTGIRQGDSLEGKSRSSTSISRDFENDIFWAPFSPSRKVTMRFPDSPAQNLRPDHHISKSVYISPQKATLLAREADSLREELSHAVRELQARRQESNHVHDLLVARAETAAQRIINLEFHIHDLDADLEANQSEMSFLRLQMRALEVQGAQYISFNADEELSESIKNWKLDWADIDQRTRVRRRKYKDIVAGGTRAGIVDDSETAIDEVR